MMEYYQWLNREDHYLSNRIIRIAQTLSDAISGNNILFFDGAIGWKKIPKRIGWDRIPNKICIKCLLKKQRFYLFILIKRVG